MSKINTNHNYGIDLLRIVAMFMIVAHHFSLHSGFAFEMGSKEAILMDILALGGKTAVNIFVLITGYYSTGKIRREKIMNLVGNTTFYSIALTLFAVALGSVSISKKLFVKAAFPWLFGNNYWFMVAYLELYLLTPILHKVTQEWDVQAYKRYLLFFTCMLCIIPTVLGKFIEVNDFGFNALVWFIYLYFLGAYLKKRTRPGKLRQYIYIYISIFIALLQITACITLRKDCASEFLGEVLEVVADYSLNAPIPLTIAILLFLGFQELVLPCGKKLIQTIAATTLGIYLFHDNRNIRGWLWLSVFQFFEDTGTLPFAANAILSILMVFTVGFCIDLLRTGVVHILRKFIGRSRRRE